MKKNRLSLAFLGLLIAASPLRAQDTPQTETAEQKDKRMEWFSQAKLGIFIHWGIYSVRGVSESWSFFNNYLPYDEYKMCIRDSHYTALLCKIIGIHRGRAAVEIIILVILIKKQPKELTHRSILEQMLFQLQSGQRFF